MERNNIDYDRLADDLAFAIRVDVPTARKIIELAREGNLNVLKYYGFSDLNNLNKRIGGISRHAPFNFSNQ